MKNIEFPLTVTGIEFAPAETLNPNLLFGGRCGDMVSVRPCGEQYNGKTFLGVLIGEIALSQIVQLNEETGVLTVGKSLHNPAIFVPDLNTVIYGCGSWWGKIKSKDDLRQITDGDIGNVWYVKALKQLEAV